MKCFTIEEINQKINGKFKGNPALLITGVDQVTDAKENQLTFIGEKKYIKAWQQSSASAAIVNDSLNIEPGPDHAFIFVSDADLALAQVLEMFEPEPPKCEVGTGWQKQGILGTRHHLASSRHKEIYNARFAPNARF